MDGSQLDLFEKLEAKARAAGLLGDKQQIQHAKTFISAKKSLGIKSTRNGFGAGGKWAWFLPPEHRLPWRATQTAAGM